MHRFFVDKKNISGKQVIITDSRVHQIRDVLRMKTGDDIIVLDNTGFEYQVRLTEILPDKVIGEIMHKKQSEAEPKTQISLFQSLLAREKFELVLQKCTEVGVKSFVPIVTERSIVRSPEKINDKKLARFESIITEAAEQSARGKIPTLASPVKFSQAVSELNDFDICLVGSTKKGCSVTLKRILQKAEAALVKVALFIGPEGGFSEKEYEIFNSRGVLTFSLGKRILRTETAAIIASAVILHELE
jgi:16S rRNA (uracil1498-N3)-methyltransferase